MTLNESLQLDPTLTEANEKPALIEWGWTGQTTEAELFCLYK